MYVQMSKETYVFVTETYEETKLAYVCTKETDVCIKKNSYGDPIKRDLCMYQCRMKDMH